MQQKVEKRKVRTTSWMVRRIILHMMAFGLLMAPLSIALSFIEEKVPAFIVSLIYFLIGALIVFWAIKMAFKVIVKLSFFSFDQVSQVAKKVILVVILIQALSVLYWYYKAPPVFSQAITTVGLYIIWDVFLFLVVSHWGKKFAKN